ncbi:hypothetical protein DPMN_160017 [Dreissena polymorpha]|uniref:Uncharacterized protein n=1 Tax=Dreissena polymorpha TaxID=45954 RepID=A0A9D4IND7_DREPO|nr:hypothetical protein DPMN_160017 [Dreissena polymorpha]
MIRYPIQILNSSITVTSNGEPYWPADWANDGAVHNQGLADDCGCCAALKRPSWLQLTLDKIYLVEKILILGRTDPGKYLQFDNITLSLGRLNQSLVDEAFTMKNGTVAQTILAPPRELDVVRVSGGMATSSHMTICEIMMYQQAACKPGTFGSNCSNICHCLNNGTCNKVDGSCLNNKCAAGWTHDNCSVACKPGTFGSNCSNICHCLNNATCNHVDGDCPNNQCAAGWTHENCSIACYPGTYGANCSSICHCLNNVACHNMDGSCPNDQCAAGWVHENCSVDNISIATLEPPESNCDRYYNAFIAVSTVLGVVVAAVIVVIVMYTRRMLRQSAGGTRSNRESTSHTYDDLSRKFMNPDHYECLQIQTIEQSTTECKQTPFQRVVSANNTCRRF